jgi:hypothetical protein
LQESRTKWNVEDFESLYHILFSPDANKFHEVIKRACHIYSQSFSINNLYERVVLLCTVLDILATNERDADPKQNFKVKDRTGYFFTREFNCSGIDGAFKNIVDDNGKILRNILEYRDEISLVMRMLLDLPTNFVTHKGTAATKKYFGSGEDLNFENNPELYSYAFIYGPRSPKHNFSYTVNMN